MSKEADAKKNITLTNGGDHWDVHV